MATIKWILNTFFSHLVRKAAKKVLFLVTGPLRGRGCATKEKRFFLMKGKKFLWPLSRGGGGAKGLRGRATKKITFFALP